MTINLLLIDDDQDDREMFYEAVESINEQITCYMEPGCRKALDKLNNLQIERPDVIFLDLNMPVMDGWQCLKVLKSNALFRDIPVVLYSTSSFPEDIEKAKHMGATSFFKKPSNFRILKKKIETVVDHIKTGSLQKLEPGSEIF